MTTPGNDRAFAPVHADYMPPSLYPGRIHEAVFELPVRASDRDRGEEAEREARAAMDLRSRESGVAAYRLTAK